MNRPNHELYKILFRQAEQKRYHSKPNEIISVKLKISISVTLNKTKTVLKKSRQKMWFKYRPAFQSTQIFHSTVWLLNVLQALKRKQTSIQFKLILHLTENQKDVAKIEKLFY